MDTMPPPPGFLAGGGEMGALIRAHDWAATPLGPAALWPQPLRTVARLMLTTNHPVFIFWGPEHTCLYNDAYSASLGPEKHPSMLGAPGCPAWAEIWDAIGPQIEMVMAGHGATWHVDHQLPIIRNGMLDEVYWTYSYSPIDDEAAPGGVGGVLVLCKETTRQVLEKRRLAFLLALQERLGGLEDPQAVMAAAAEALGRHLGVGRAGYVEIEPNGEFFTAGRDWTDAAMRSLVGRYRLDDFGPDLIREYRENRILSIEDVLADPRGTDQGRAKFGSIDTRAVIGVPLLRAGRFAAVLSVHHATPRRWRDDEVALVRDVAERTWSMLQRVRAEAALRESEARFRALVEVSAQVVWTADAEGATLEDNPSWRAYTGQTPAEWQGQGWRDAIHPEDRERTAAARRVFLAAKVPYNIEYRLRHHAGGHRWTHARATPLLDATGCLRLWVGMNTDIEERKRAEARTALLTREVDHRAKNALAVVQAVLRLTRAPDAKSFVRVVEGRVSALARAQTLLARDHWEGADLETLLRGELAPFLGEAAGPWAELAGPPVLLPSGATQPLAMAMHELATNAVKYGALSAPGGRVDLSWTLERARAEGRMEGKAGAGGSTGTLRLRWAEVGGPRVPGPPPRRGFGSRVLDETLRSQLGGTIELDWRPEGLACELSLPLRMTA